MSSHADQRAYIHFSRFPSPINPVFYGQTFVINNLTSATARFGNGSRKSYVFANSRGSNGPLDETIFSEKAGRLSRERFNAELRLGYGLEAIDNVLGLVQGLVREDTKCALVFHYPVSRDTEFARELRRRITKLGIDDKVAILFYLHTQADNIVHQLATPIGAPEGAASARQPSFMHYHNSMIEAVDGLIAVSDAVRGTYVRIDEGVSTLCSVVRNGIDPFIYSITSEREIEEARESIGFSKKIRTLVSYAGRMDKIKGSDFLVRTLEHYEKSRDERDCSVGFLLATPHLINLNSASRQFRTMLNMSRLIEEDRLKVVLDVSKYTRGDPRFKSDIEDIMLSYARENGLGHFEKNSAYGGLCGKPVQTISDIYLHPSRSEGLPLSIVEAVFGGAYVIATRVGGIPEIVNDPRLGTLVEFPEELRQANKSDVARVENGTRKFVDTIVARIRDFCGTSSGRMFDRAALSQHLQSYSDYNMFAAFEEAITRIFARKNGWDG